jgi:hypothetical protein
MERPMIVIVLILLGLCAWCYYRWRRTQRQLAQVNQVVEHLVAGDIRIESLADASQNQGSPIWPKIFRAWWLMCVARQS